MTENSGEEKKFGQVFRKSWLRKGRKADLTDVPVHKINEASKRGVEIDLVESSPNKRIAQVNKVFIEGDDKI